MCRVSGALARSIPVGRIFAVAGLLVAIGIGGWSMIAQAAQSGLPSRTVQARLIRVIDGDSILVREQNGRKRNIRLAGIDAPELRQAFGRQAKASLSEILDNQPLRLQITKKDRYGRLIATVIAGRTSAGLAQINAGYAWFYRRYRHEQSQADQQAYEQAELRARRLGRGLWRQSNPVAPWEYRRQQRRRR